MQTQLDAYHRDHPGPPDPQHYEDFLRSIGYLQPEPDDFKITTSNVDPEITRQFGPQLIVPLLNARFAANAANARWGSLYDAVYGTDVIPDEGELARGAKYNPRRGERVIAFGPRLLDEFFPLTGASHTDVDTTQVARGALIAGVAGPPRWSWPSPASLPATAASWTGPARCCCSITDCTWRLHVDRTHPIGRAIPPASATCCWNPRSPPFMDLEDSVAAVDAEDKMHLYRNWLGLMSGGWRRDSTKDGSRRSAA